MNYYTFTNAQSIVMRSASDAPAQQPRRWPDWLRHRASNRELSPTPWRRNRFLMLFSLSMGVCMCVPSAVALFVHYQRACERSTAAAASTQAPLEPPNPDAADWDASVPPSADCPDSRFNGPALLLYLTFLIGLCISISTLAAGLLCTPPDPESRGCWAALRRRFNTTLCWDQTDSPRSVAASFVSDGGSVYEDRGDNSGEMRGLRVFTGVLVQLPHHEAAAGQARSGSILVGVIDNGSRAATPASSPRKPHPHVWEAFSPHSVPAALRAAAAAPQAASGSASPVGAHPSATPLAPVPAADARAACCPPAEPSSRKPSTQRTGDADGPAAVCGSTDTAGSSDDGSSSASSAGSDSFQKTHGTEAGTPCSHAQMPEAVAMAAETGRSGMAASCVDGPPRFEAQIDSNRACRAGLGPAGSACVAEAAAVRSCEGDAGLDNSTQHGSTQHRQSPAQTGQGDWGAGGSAGAERSDADDSASLHWQAEASEAWLRGSLEGGTAAGQPPGR